MYVYIYICIYMYVHIYIYTYIYICTHHRANVAHIRQPRPHSDLGFQAKVFTTVLVVPSSLGRPQGANPHLSIFRCTAFQTFGTMVLNLWGKTSNPCIDPHLGHVVIPTSNSF